MRCARVWLATVAISALIASSLCAGDLDPPGAPASTPGPEPRIAINQENTPGDDSAFFVIRSRGSYYLTGNLVNRFIFGTKHGILIESSDVTLDLNGFTLDGSERVILPLSEVTLQGPAQPVTGILASGELENITIRNGTVRGWSDFGILLYPSSNIVVENVTASRNDSIGIATGHASIVSHCVATDNGGPGIRARGGSSLVISCVASDNGTNGIRMLGDGSSVISCISNSNGEGGISMIGGATAFATQCTAISNRGSGISLGAAGGVALSNMCHSNRNEGGSAAGIRASVDARIEANDVRFNNIGIAATGRDNLVIRNSAQANDTNYDIGGGSSAGPIIPIGNPITSTNPWANFEL